MQPLLALLARLEDGLPNADPPTAAAGVPDWLGRRTFAQLDRATAAIRSRLRSGQWPETAQDPDVAAELWLRLQFATAMATTVLLDPDSGPTDQAEDLLCGGWLLAGLAWARHCYR
jgi:hypothetical protein